MIVFAVVVVVVVDVVVVVVDVVKPFFDGDKMGVLGFNFLLKFYNRRNEVLNIKFVQIRVWNAVRISRNELDRQFSHLFAVNNCPDVNNVVYDTTKGAGFPFNTFDGKVGDRVSDWDLITLGDERIFCF